MKNVSLTLLYGLLAALLGAIVGAVAGGFLHFIEWAQHLIWHTLMESLPVQALLVCVAGGLFVGLCQRYLGDHPKSLENAIAEIRQTGRLDYKHLPQGLLTASASLIFGASLGPEAALADIIGGLSTWSGDVMRAFRRRFNLPDAQKSPSKAINLLRKWPTIIASIAGIIVIGALLGGMYGGGFLDLSGHPFQWADLIWAIPFGILGAAAGWLYMEFQNQLPRVLTPIQNRPVLRGLLGGFLLGLIALSLPMVLFSGQYFLNPIIGQAAELGFWTLLLTGLARLFLTALLLSTGWKGGQFLPILFGASALGLSISLLLPAAPASVATLGTMGALIAVVLPNPLIALVLMVLMFPLEYAGISIIAVGVVVIGKRMLQNRATPVVSPSVATD